MTAGAEWKLGWRLVLAAALGIGSGISIFGYVFSLFVLDWEAEFGWSRSDIVLAYLAAPVAALFLPFIGAIVDRRGPQTVAIVSVILLCVVYGFIINIGPNVWSLYICLFAASVLGAGSGPITYSRAVARSFDRTRGLALAIALSGTAILAMIFPPILNIIIEQWGWRAGVAALGVAAFAIGIPAALLGLGEKLPHAEAHSRTASGTAIASGMSVAAALKSYRFWVLCACVFLIAAPVFGAAAHMKPLFLERGLSSAEATAMISIFGGSVLIGRLLTGFLIDRFWAPAVATVLVLTSAIGAFVAYIGGESIWLSALSVFLLGAAQGAELDIMAYLTSRYFGMRRFSTLYGTLTIAYSVAFPTGALIYAETHALTGQYDTALLFAISSLVAAAVLLPTLGRFPPEEARWSLGQESKIQ